MTVRPRLTYANVVSTIALVLAMSTGGAYAAGLITTSQIADGAVTTPKLRDNAVSRAKVRDAAVGTAELGAGSVTGAKVAAETLTGADVMNGAVGPDDLSLPARAPAAFAHVRWDGIIVPDDPSSVLTAAMISTSDPTGQYCISGLPFGPRSVATASTMYLAAPSVVTATIGPAGTCPVGTQVTVVTIDLATRAQYGSSFQINLWP